MDNSSATPAPVAAPNDGSASAAGFDTGSHESFYEYYKRQSLSPATMQRFSAMAEVVMRMRADAAGGPALAVLDVGCGAGAQCRFWAERGVSYCGIDINEPLVRLARERAAEQGHDARFEVRALIGDGNYEDPVTGSLNASLAQWMIESGLAPSSYVSAQGAVLQRAGRVHIEQIGDTVWVGGDVAICIEGEVEI